MHHPSHAQEQSSPPLWSKQVYWILALGIFCAGAWQRSLWTDEFHSLHHAKSQGLQALLSSVRSDNHPPLSFLLEHLSISLFGSSEIALRLPSILVGLLFLALLRRSLELIAPSKESRRAPWFALASSYFFVLFSEARMYALLALATLGLMLTLGGALTQHKRAYSRWWLSFWIAVGLHSHYYFIHELLITGLFLALAWCFQPQVRQQFRSLALPSLLGLLCFVPWAWYGFIDQIQAQLPPGHAVGNLSLLRDGFAHMFHWNASLGGPAAIRFIAIPGTAIAGVALFMGILRLLPKIRSQGPQGVQALMLLVYGLGLPSMAWIISRFSTRSTFGWRYLAGSAISVIIIATLGLSGTSNLKRALSGLLLLSMSSITLINLATGGHEDHRRLVSYVIQNALPDDAVLDNPPYFQQPLAHQTSWQYYVNRQGEGNNPTLPVAFAFPQFDQARQRSRIWVWFRDQYHPWVLRELRKSHPVEKQWSMGTALTLHLFSKEQASDGK